MKKIILIFAVVFSFFILPDDVFAVDFSITDTKIDAYLQENGDVQVTEQHIYHFESEFNGITRSLISKERTNFTDFQAFENGKPLDVEREENVYKIYRSGSNEEIQIEITYNIINGVDVYTDMAQFYWPFFDSNNKSTYQNMDIFIHPPQETEDVLALGYDEAYATSRTGSDGVVHFAMGEVESGTKGDILVAYDASLFPAANHRSDKKIRDNILAEQTALAEERQAFEDRQGLLNRISPFIVGGLSIYLLILLLISWRKKNSRILEVERTSLSSQNHLNQEMSLPASILYMKNISVGSEIIPAALLDLVRKGYAKRDGEDTFVIVDKNTEFSHEKILIEWLFYTIGKNGVFTTSDLSVYTKDEANHSAYSSNFAEWTQAVKEEIKQNHLVEKVKGIRWTTGIVSLLTIPLIIMLGVHSLFMWMFFTIVPGMALLLFAIIYQPRTVQGHRIRKQWIELSTNYENISEKEWNDWMSDEQMRAFIYAIGTGNKSMQKKYERLIKNLSSSSSSEYGLQANDVIMYALIASTLANDFNKADSTISAASSSSGGGVSGGGTGVGGGGGGSGAF
ncbi:Uncharacterized membrane protein [Gracilibacillus ureilyticus]|uniref:Uncharacterized membrane protein n=1 Tax=Gracilibacillus ureilyticus TaxID=531814 RepID=A0A1H9U7G2_9BACI|nr:DUF2207 domain-containing protein [Gracilibacillus ureilyticus]SES05289.1 Uncharacterized membrane protein [Gracilibacillus ureilyticus]